MLFITLSLGELARSLGKRGHGRRTTDAGHRTNDGKDGQRWKRRTNDGKDGQTMEKTDNDGKDGQRWKRRTNDGKDGQTMEKTDKRWKRRTNDGKDGQTIEKTDKRWKRRTRFPIDRPFTNTYRLKFRFVSYLLLKIANMSNSHRSNSDI